MATATQAPATDAGGPTQHTQNRLTPPQLRLLHGAVNPTRVQNLRGLAHMEAWDIRRELIRVFGFGGYSIDTLALDLVAERETKQGEKSRWTVVYRAHVRLTVFDVNGDEISHWDGTAAGDSVNQPSLGDAHDMALKTADSQALKRAATNLGDQFGLSLYNDGSREPVVNFSAAHPPAQWQKAEAPQPDREDPPVKPEPQPQTTDADPEPPAAVQVKTSPKVETVDAVQAALLDKLMAQVREHWNNPDVLHQVQGEAIAKNLIDLQVQGPNGHWGPFRDLLNHFIQKAEQKGAA